MANVCGVSLHVCRIRATRLDDVGNVAPSPNNSYVSDAVVQITVTPTIEEGQSSTLRGGCACIIASYEGPDLLKGFELEFTEGKIEPALQEMMLGATLIVDGSDNVGIWHPGPLDCGDTQPSVGFEFWTDVWVGSAQSGERPYIHHLYPSTTWQTGQQTYEDDFAQNPLSGKAAANTQWGSGPYGDQPEDIPATSPGGYFYTADALPPAECDYADVVPAS